MRLNAYKIRALEKLSVEIKGKNSGYENHIYEWLITQSDADLFIGVIKRKKSLDGAVSYCKANAKKLAKGNVAMVHPSIVYEWLSEYFKSQTIDFSPTKIRNVTKKERSKPKNSKGGTEQIDLFDSL